MYYLAYGSNLHPIRLSERILSAKNIGVIEISGYQLKFNKIGIDQSGKCNVEKTKNNDNSVIFALYEIEDKEKKELDEFESCGHGYEVQYIDLIVNHYLVTAFTYVAMGKYINNDLLPFSWYKSLTLLGMKYHSFDECYIHEINKVDTIEDEDLKRVDRNTALIEKIQANNRIHLTVKSVTNFAIAKISATFYVK